MIWETQTHHNQNYQNMFQVEPINSFGNRGCIIGILANGGAHKHDQGPLSSANKQRSRNFEDKTTTEDRISFPNHTTKQSGKQETC